MFEPDVQVTIRVPEAMKRWLEREAKRNYSNTSVVIRQAIKLLMKQRGSERDEE